MAKLVERLLATGAPWIRIQTFKKNTKWVPYVTGQHTLARKKERIFLRCEYSYDVHSKLPEKSKFMLCSLLSYIHFVLIAFVQILTGEDWNEVMYDGIVSQGGHR